MAPNDPLNIGAQGTPPDTTNPSGTVVYITPDTAIPPFRCHLRNHESQVDEGISLDVILALLEGKFSQHAKYFPRGKEREINIQFGHRPCGRVGRDNK